MLRRRCVELEGMSNLRDLGGYRTKDGTKTTKWGVIYRGDQPSKVPADVAQKVLVDQLRIRNAYDLRDVTETRVKSYDIPHITRHAFSIDMSRMGELLLPGENTNEGPVAAALMQRYYRHLVTAEGAAVGAVLKALLRARPSSEHAAMLHCTAGKDRTGWTVYLLLSLLDIADAEKRADYMLTGQCFKIPREAYEYEGAAEMSAEAFDAFWGVSTDYIDAATAEVEKLGGVVAYAKSHMGLTEDDVQQLRDILLE